MSRLQSGANKECPEYAVEQKSRGEPKGPRFSRNTRQNQQNGGEIGFFLAIGGSDQDGSPRPCVQGRVEQDERRQGRGSQGRRRQDCRRQGGAEQAQRRQEYARRRRDQDRRRESRRPNHQVPAKSSAAKALAGKASARKTLVGKTLAGKKSARKVLAEKSRATTKAAAKARVGVKKSTATLSKTKSKATSKTGPERSRTEKLQASASAATRKAAGKTRQAKTATTHQQAKIQDKKIQDKKAVTLVVAPKSSAAPTPSSPAKTVVVAKASPTAASGKATESRTPAASESTQVAKKAPEKAPEKAPLAVPPAPVKPVQPAPSAGPADAKAAAPAKALVKPKATAQRLGFKMNEFVVYPAHGVGQITGVDIQEVAGFSLELFVVSFIKDKMILKVPTSKVTSVGMRKLAEMEVVDKALGTLSGRARVKRTMWSRRAQEYEAKINSGDLVTIAEVVRDLYRSDTQPEQSYSERQLYEAALDRMGREIAAVRKLIDSEALALIESFLLKGPKRGQKNDADIAADGADQADVDRAA